MEQKAWYLSKTIWNINQQQVKNKQYKGRR